jgi:hypothetical protein
LRVPSNSICFCHTSQETVANLLNIPFDETNSYFTFNDAAYKQLNQQVKSIAQYFAELRAIEIALTAEAIQDVGLWWP